jgi:hypothetical protein
MAVKRATSVPTNPRSWVAYSVSMIFTLSVLTLVYLLPHDIVDRSTATQQTIHHVAYIVPSMSRLGNLSTFSQVAQVTYLIELFCVPLLTWTYARYLKFDVAEIGYSKTRALLAITILPGAILVILLMFPFNPESQSWAGRMSRSLIESRSAFAIWSAILAMGISICIVGFFKWLGALYHAIRNAP